MTQILQFCTLNTFENTPECNAAKQTDCFLHSRTLHQPLNYTHLLYKQVAAYLVFCNFETAEEYEVSRLRESKMQQHINPSAGHRASQINTVQPSYIVIVVFCDLTVNKIHMKS